MAEGPLALDLGSPGRLAGWIRSGCARRLLALLVLSLTAQAQAGGFTTEKHPELGLSFPRARYYEQIPTQPDEEWVVLYYAEKLDVTKRRERKLRPEMRIVWIDWFPDPKPVDPDSPGALGDEVEKRTRAEPMKPKGPLPITTFERFVGSRMRGWEIGKSEQGKQLGDYEGREISLAREASPNRSNNRTQQAAWAYTWKSDRRTIAVIGTCAEQDLPEQSKIWRQTAEKMKIVTPAETDLAKLERYYDRREVIDPEFRIKVRSQLVRGWKAEDTENYIIIYSTRDAPLVRRVCRELEQLRKAYLDLFPPVGEITAVSTVRICKNREEYILYGGSPRSAGYWNSEQEELVFYDASDKTNKSKRSNDDNTFIVLYHEAFHQYIHYSAGELPPHSWYNEGHGDYFSGALIKGGKLKRIGVNPWRVGTIKAAVGRGDFVPWKKIIRYSQMEYYRNARLCYAQGWSMIYFLLNSKKVESHADWSRILPTYFEVLKATYAQELEDRGNPEEAKLRAEAGRAAREKAVEAAFHGVELDELQDVWEDFVLGLKVPRR